MAQIGTIKRTEHDFDHLAGFFLSLSESKSLEENLGQINLG